MNEGPQSIARSGTLSAAALGYLQQNPLAHELLLGLWEEQPVGHGNAWWVLSQGECVLGVVSFRPPRSIIFSNMSPGAASFLAAAIKRFAPAAYAVHAPAGLTNVLSERLTLGPIERRTQILALWVPPPVRPGDGQLLRVGQTQRGWARQQIQACLVERTGQPVPVSTMKYWERCDTVYRWRNRSGQAVAMVIQNRCHVWGSCLGLVYTLPEHRRSGYAKAMISALCTSLFEQGKVAVFLHADSKDPRASALYAELGFAPVQTLVTWFQNSPKSVWRVPR